MPPTIFGMLCEPPRAVSRIDALGGEGEEELLSHREPGGGEAGQQHFLGRARIGGGLEDDQLAGAQDLRHVVGRGHDVGDVGLLGFPQRRGHADDDGVGGREGGDLAA